MYKTSAVGDTARPSYSQGDNIRIVDGTMGNANRLEVVENKIDIITLDKINKISILVSC